jgi:quinoprotein relay system zinc metallohydrolase 2
MGEIACSEGPVAHARGADRRMRFRGALRRIAIATTGAWLAIAAPAPASEPTPLPVREIAPGVFVHEAPVALADPDNLGAIANIGFIVGTAAVAVIDTGGSLAAGKRLLAAVRLRTDLPIRYVINTHVHPDHVLGNAAFRASGTAFIGHRHLPEALAARSQRYLEANRALVGPRFDGTEIVPPTGLVERALTIDLGGRHLEIEAWPTAHTNTDLTIRDVATDTWFLGDLLFVRHVPALDGKLTGWIAALRALRERPAARVVPGHGPVALPWPGAAEPIGRYLDRLAADIRSLIRQGATMRESADRAARSEEGDWDLFDAFNTRNGIAAYQELEWD